MPDETADGPRPVDLLADELGRVRYFLALLADHLAPPRLLYKRRLRLTSAQPFFDLLSQDLGGQKFGTLIVENPQSTAGMIVEVGFTPGSGRLGSSDVRVPRQMGLVIVGDFDQASIGIDAAVLSSSATEVFIRCYDKKLQPAAYAYTP